MAVLKTFSGFKSGFISPVPEFSGTGQPGSYVPVGETVRGFKEILDGKYDHLPEDAFRGVGSIEDVIAKAEKMGF